eukprot:scaffold56059_cov31-Tisochrysis_lutea.AAC.3
MAHAAPAQAREVRSSEHGQKAPAVTAASNGRTVTAKLDAGMTAPSNRRTVAASQGQLHAHLTRL